MGIRKSFFIGYGILMTTLPPYHPDYNPEEFVFRALLRRISSERNNSLNVDNFLDAICIEMSDFHLMIPFHFIMIAVIINNCFLYIT